MNQVITDPNILKQINLLLEENPNVFFTRSLNYCSDILPTLGEKCENFTIEKIILDKPIAYYIFGFKYDEFEDSVDNSDKIKKVKAYQRLGVCEDHYEELLKKKILTKDGIKILTYDKNQRGVEEGIFGNSLVFAPHKARGSKVFTIRNGILTLPKSFYQTLPGVSIPTEDEARKKFDQQITLDKKIINTFTEAYKLKDIYEGISGAVLPS